MKNKIKKPIRVPTANISGLWSEKTFHFILFEIVYHTKKAHFLLKDTTNAPVLIKALDTKCSLVYIRELT